MGSCELGGGASERVYSGGGCIVWAVDAVASGCSVAEMC